MKIWVVGETITETPQGQVWDIHGVFTTEAAAVAACLTPQYFVGPLAADERLPVERVKWDGCYYPIAP